MQRVAPTDKSLRKFLEMIWVFTLKIKEKILKKKVIQKVS